jgi:hypothetical protein
VKLAQAVEIYLRDQPIVDAVSKQLDEAKKVIKAHCHAKGLPTYRGIGYSRTITQRLDAKLARAALGPKKTAECTVDSARESLTLPAHLRRGAIDLAATGS